MQPKIDIADTLIQELHQFIASKKNKDALAQKIIEIYKSGLAKNYNIVSNPYLVKFIFNDLEFGTEQFLQILQALINENFSFYSPITTLSSFDGNSSTHFLTFNNFIWFSLRDMSYLAFAPEDDVDKIINLLVTHLQKNKEQYLACMKEIKQHLSIGTNKLSLVFPGTHYFYNCLINMYDIFYQTEILLKNNINDTMQKIEIL